MVSGGMSCIKYLLFCFNLLFAISGIAILTVGAILHISYSDYTNFVDRSYQYSPIILIAVGVIIFIVAFLGCCGAVKENICMIVTFIVLLVAILILEIIVGLVGYIKKNEVEVMLEKNLNSTMHSYYNNPEIRKSWDITQHEAECCGVKGPKDWTVITKNDSLPHTCCPDTPDDGTCTTHLNHYKVSCLEKMKTLFNRYGAIIGGVGVGIGAAQLIGVLFATCLARSIRKEYETV
ncbi:unnamed protein product [Acanthoscelides obtectus]|uniref:Tetraspanin n=1 Tax=Acanthoscelides obtectus TaxID=200917 RepID=A0A9P0PIW3_ACAOB|nr:unnamed protein product [Acanthoscelides obtectus]CAK1623443.1 CD63 antigen [Acanthoscelides obtectus]